MIKTTRRPTCKNKACKKRFTSTIATQMYCTRTCKQTAANAAISVNPMHKRMSDFETKVISVCVERGYTFEGYQEAPTSPTEAKLLIGCQDHGAFVPATSWKFLEGSGCPSCAGRTFNYAYIHILNDGAADRAIKFGVSNTPLVRLETLNIRNQLSTLNTHLYHFDNPQDCWLAEKVCKNTLECGVIPVWEMQDGHTETTSINNIQRVIDIYEEYGGTLWTASKPKEEYTWFPSCA